MTSSRNWNKTKLLESSRFTVDDGDFLNFNIEEEHTISGGASTSSPVKTSNTAAPLCRGARNAALYSDLGEEEDLEWISNKESFPTLDTCFDILSDNPELLMNHQSPVSVLENSNSNGSNRHNNNLNVPNHPVRARSKTMRRARFVNLPSQQPFQVNDKIGKEEQPLTNGVAGIGRRCLHCQAEKTPQWRAGPNGPKTLCNACGVRYKSGRLLPEYRPASSPTFSNELHSNSHRKVVEMRRQKNIDREGFLLV